MKKIKTICLLLCLLVIVGAVSVGAEELGTVSGLSCRTLDAQVALGGSDKLVDTSNAVIVYDRSSETVVYSYNIDAQIYPSSMVKLMTALVALEQGNLDDVCTVSRAALDAVAIGSVSANLQRWEEISLRDLLYCMMVASANDAAAVIAQHIAGSQEGFVELMNQKAIELGCTGTHFSNVHGLHDEQTYTTARDICRIIDAGLSNPEFEAMFKTAKYTVPATNKSEERTIHTTNYMISKEVNGKYFDARVTGGKTGATDKAGRCLAISAEINGMDLVAIVMGAKPTYEVEGIVLSRHGSFEEMAEILDHVEEHYEHRQIFYANQSIAQYPVSGGSNHVSVTPDGTLYCVLPKGAEEVLLTWSYGPELDSLKAPIEKGQVLSELKVWYNGICVAQTDLLSMHDVEEYQPYTGEDIHANEIQEEQHGELIALILAVIAGAAVLILLSVFLFRIIRDASRRAKIRRRRRNRRRDQNA